MKSKFWFFIYRLADESDRYGFWDGFLSDKPYEIVDRSKIRYGYGYPHKGYIELVLMWLERKTKGRIRIGMPALLLRRSPRFPPIDL